MLHPTAPRRALATARRAARAVDALPATGPAAQEQELKLRLRPQDVALLRARFDALSPSDSEQVDSIYLDTPDHRLAAARAALRLRALGRGRRQRWVQTLKTDDSGAAFSLRGEWETGAPGGRLNPTLLAGSPLLQLLTPAGGALAGDPYAQLAPVFRTRFSRTTWDLAAFGARIEAVIDVGAIEAGGSSEAILEAELELKAGPAAAIWLLALELSGGGAHADLCLLPYGDSKAARGYRLAMGSPAAPRPVSRVRGLEPGQPAADVACRLVAHDMIPLLANAIGLQSDADPEYVHQARVCLRRMRANLDVLGVHLPAALERGLRLWGDRFGTVRDWDVFCGQLLPRLVDDLGAQDPAGWARICAAAGRRREAATLRLRRQLDAPAFAALALRLLQWAAGPAPARAKASRPVGEVAAKALRKRLRRVAKAGLLLSRCSAERQHHIRLQAKTVRYAVDSLGEVLPAKLQSAGRRALARFQDAAGRAQDALVVVAAVERLTRSVSLRGAVSGWAAARRRKAIAKAQGYAARLSV